MKLITNKDKDARSNILRNLLDELGHNSIEGFQKDRGLTIDGLFGTQSYNTLYHILLNVNRIDFDGYYFNVRYPKKQIVWHHSAGWDDSRSMYNWWKNDKVQHVATSVGVGDDGKLYKGFDEAFWAHHIGAHHWHNLRLNKISVAIELCNWGALNYKGGEFTSWAGVTVPISKVIDLDFRGIRYFERYTNKEINTLKYWTLLNAMRFDIPLSYDEKRMFEVNSEALNGEAGLYTHCSFLRQKSDVSPQPHLIEMAKELSNYEK